MKNIQNKLLKNIFGGIQEKEIGGIVYPGISVEEYNILMLNGYYITLVKRKEYYDSLGNVKPFKSIYYCNIHTPDGNVAQIDQLAKFLKQERNPSKSYENLCYIQKVRTMRRRSFP